MWKVNDRVFGRKGSEPHWYTGTVRHIDGERCYVIFDDGDDALMEEDRLKKMELHAGDPIFARLPVEKEFRPAKVLALDNDRVQVQWTDGQENWASFAMIRLQPDTVREANTQDSTWTEGDRVLACWHDLFWYPGVVVSINGGQHHIMFDAGHQVMLGSDRIHPIEFEVGDRIFARWKGGPEFCPGEITERRDEVIHVRYDDGDEEVTSIRLARLQRDDWFPPSEIGDIQIGTRVLACWFDNHWYPGTVFTIDGKRLHVLFDDGDHAFLTPDRVRELEVNVGDRLYCRFKAGPAYYPGEITRKDGEVIHIRYDDGDEETTLVRMVRIQDESNEQSQPQSE